MICERTINILINHFFTWQLIFHDNNLALLVHFQYINDSSSLVRSKTRIYSAKVIKKIEINIKTCLILLQHSYIVRIRKISRKHGSQDFLVRLGTRRAYTSTTTTEHDDGKQNASRCKSRR